MMQVNCPDLVACITLLHQAPRSDVGVAAHVQQNWQEQNEWMDYYRVRLGPDEGYYYSPGGSPGGHDASGGSESPERMTRVGIHDMRSTQSSPGGVQYKFLSEMKSPSTIGADR